MTPEAFVYTWHDKSRDMLYIGVHKGSPEDGYICSSKLLLLEHAKRPKDFSRDVVYSGTWLSALQMEQDLIKICGAVKSPLYYNQACGFGPYWCDWTGKHFTPETCAKISMAKKGILLGPMKPEHKSKISVTMTGYAPTTEHKEHVSQAKSSEWEMTNIHTGKIIVVPSLRKFCENNNLSRSAMVAQSTGRYAQHRGWKCKKKP